MIIKNQPPSLSCANQWLHLRRSTGWNVLGNSPGALYASAISTDVRRTARSSRGTP